MPNKSQPSTNFQLHDLIKSIDGFTTAEISTESYLAYSGELDLYFHEYYESGNNCCLALIGKKYNPDAKLAYFIELKIDDKFLIIYFEPKDESSQSLKNIECVAKTAFNNICKFAINS